MPAAAAERHPRGHDRRAAAPPQDIWPWLVQWGWNRAGFYSYDLLDNLGRPSARQILPQFQHLAVGDWVPNGRQDDPLHRLPGRPARTRHAEQYCGTSPAAAGCGCWNRMAPDMPG